MLITCFFYAGCSILKFFMDYWLGRWVLNSYSGLTQSQYIGIYYTIMIFSGIFYYFRYMLFAIFSTRSCNYFHSSLLTSLLQSPMNWFD